MYTIFVFVVNAPRMFPVLYNLVSPFVDPRTLEVIYIYIYIYYKLVYTIFVFVVNAPRMFPVLYKLVSPFVAPGPCLSFC